MYNHKSISLKDIRNILYKIYIYFDFVWFDKIKVYEKFNFYGTVFQRRPTS